jgi:hypothetical protein
MAEKAYTDFQKLNGCVSDFGERGRIPEGAREGTVEISTNVHEGQPCETDGLVGKVLLMHRPNDVEADFPGKEHLMDIKQVFEFRLQARFKRPITGDLKLAVEANVTAVGFFAGIVINTVLSVAKMISAVKGSNFDYKYPGGEGTIYLEWSAAIEVDSLTETKAGEEPPPLTDNFPFMPVEERPSTFNDVDTYTFIYWTNFYDAGRWMLTNLPGTRDTALAVSACHFLVKDDEGVLFHMRQEPVEYTKAKDLTSQGSTGEGSLCAEDDMFHDAEDEFADQEDLDLD